MSSFWSSVFSICDESKVDFNGFTTTSYSLKSFQAPYFKTHKLQRQRQGDALDVSKAFVNRVTWKSSDPTTWIHHMEGFLQRLILPMLENQFQQICMFSQKIYQANKKSSQSFYWRNNHLIIWYCSLDGDLSHTTDMVYYPFSMTSIWGKVYC